MKMFVVFVMVLIAATMCRGQERYPLESYRDYGKDTRSYSPKSPRIYSEDGTYLGELSQNRYSPDSINNRFGKYGSRYSQDSINNRWGPYGRYSTQQIWVYPRW